MEKIFVTNLEEFENLEIEYNLEDNGMSGDHYGWHWYQDDEAGVAVYLKIVEPEVFIGCEWGNIKENLEKYITVDKENVDNETGECIVDFEGDYAILSIKGKIINDELIIEDEAVIYQNCI